jgi:hypothetical protein
MLHVDDYIRRPHIHLWTCRVFHALIWDLTGVLQRYVVMRIGWRILHVLGSKGIPFVLFFFLLACPVS